MAVCPLTLFPFIFSPELIQPRALSFSEVGPRSFRASWEIDPTAKVGRLIFPTYLGLPRPVQSSNSGYFGHIDDGKKRCWYLQLYTVGMRVTQINTNGPNMILQWNSHEWCNVNIRFAFGLNTPCDVTAIYFISWHLKCEATSQWKCIINVFKGHIWSPPVLGKFTFYMN